jgi:hypothetical protein
MQDHSDFTNRELWQFGADALTGTVVGSCFAQDRPDTVVFHPDTVCAFLNCNLDNCQIPAGCTVGEGCSTRRIGVQNDGEDWLLDADNKPTAPVNLEAYVSLGLSIEPAAIPSQPLLESIVMSAMRKAAEPIEKTPIVDEFVSQRDAAKIAAIAYIYSHPDCTEADVIAASQTVAPMISGAYLMGLYVNGAKDRGFISEASFGAFKMFVLGLTPEQLMAI